MKPNGLVSIVSILLLPSAALMAQVARKNDVPLKNWATPLYWQPNQGERAAAAKAVPQLKLSPIAASTDALTFVAITPCRLVDTRGAAAGFFGVPPFNGPSIPAGGAIEIPVQSPEYSSGAPAPCGIFPSAAQAYSLNLTVVPGGAVDYVTMWPVGGPRPFVATLNDPQGLIVSNAATVSAGHPAGGINVYNAGPAATDVVIDINGYYAAPTDMNGNTAVGSGALANSAIGGDNTASGFDALQSNYAGNDNTASGASALSANTTGSYNTASGAGTLAANTTGYNNTADGFQALYSNLTGSNNTASGYLGLQNNTTGSGNAAIGAYALQNNTIGAGNTASGTSALRNNTTGSDNTASGSEALLANTTGNSNTALGGAALIANLNGGGNTAVGADALSYNGSGANNTALGVQALQHNISGNFNIAVGYNAAVAVSTASNNIHIGSYGVMGDNNVIRIGTTGTQTNAFITGISGATPGTPNLFVCVDANGQLGTSGCTGGAPSSQRFKEQIADMGDSSSKLFQLRPVTFLYKPQYDDGSHSLQYGLIAEEVAKLYPEMVGYDKDGQPSSVKYQSLAPMLLNEVQKQNVQIQALENRLAALEALLSGKTSERAEQVNNQ